MTTHKWQKMDGKWRLYIVENYGIHGRMLGWSGHRDSKIECINDMEEYEGRFKEEILKYVKENL